MRSSLSHLDKADSGAKKAAASAAAGSEGGDTTESEGEEAKPVIVKFARKENKAKGQQKGVGRRINYQEFVENKKSSEAWVKVHYNDIDSEEAAEERRLLFAEREDQSSVFSQTVKGYVDTICPKVVTHEATPPVAMPTGVLSLTELKSLPLAQGVIKLLRSVHMIQFSPLCSLLGVIGGGVLSVCEAVKSCAVLVQGCWVVSSQQLFPGDENTTKRNSRDYIVSLISVLPCFNLPKKIKITSLSLSLHLSFSYLSSCGVSISKGFFLVRTLWVWPSSPLRLFVTCYSSWLCPRLPSNRGGNSNYQLTMILLTGIHAK